MRDEVKRQESLLFELMEHGQSHWFQELVKLCEMSDEHRCKMLNTRKGQNPRFTYGGGENEAGTAETAGR